MSTVFEKGQKKQKAYSLPKDAAAFHYFHPPIQLCRKSEIPLPELSELDLTRHFCGLAKRNVGIDTTFYPLGSCTMKLNPRVNELCASLSQFSRTHPLAPQESVQGNLHVMFELIEMLCDLCGMKGGTLLPCAGAHGEYVGIKMIAAYHRANGDTGRTEFLIPDNAHGTNPASAAMAGFTARSIPSTAHGDLDLKELKEALSSKTAGLMLTNPSTLGLFSEQILQIAKLVHEAGGLLYYDGANLNAIANVVRPGDMGFDVMHLNLHKTFSTPHGGGGPGSGPVLCKERLVPYLPVPRVMKHEGHFTLEKENQNSIGMVSSFHGNFAIYLRAYLYFKLHGHYGMRRIAEHAVLNANYLKKRLEPLFTIPFKQPCMHEFVVSADNYLSEGVKALDIAKRLLDFGVYAPTIYFPLIIKECMLIEPTECESKQTLDDFVSALQSIVQEIQTDAELVKTAPRTTVVSRLDEVKAAKHPVLKAFIPNPR